jgi:hypothetical protein
MIERPVAKVAPQDIAQRLLAQLCCGVSDSADSQPPAPDAPPKKLLGRSAVPSVTRQIRHERGLKPWMLTYAEWLILECDTKPTRTERIVRARGFSRGKVYDTLLRELETRPDFVKYCDELAKGPLEQARAKFMSKFPTYVEAHADALEQARLAQDYTAVARIAEPVLDRIIPRKVEGTTAPAAVTIVLTAQQAAGIRAYAAPAIAVEAIEPGPVVDD